MLSESEVTSILMAWKHQIYFFFSADFVVLPPLVVFSTDLITPTATVCRMSRTAKRYRVGFDAVSQSVSIT